MDLRVYETPTLNREALKASRISPDGVLQMALQLSHYRLHGYLPSTYESASTSAFKSGRTERIPTASAEVLLMCEAFAAKTGHVHGKHHHHRELSSEDARALYRLVQDAVAEHKRRSLQCVMGKGVDRHLFALQQWATRTGLTATGQPEIFRDYAYQRYKTIRLSTSTLSSDALEGGGFGPVSGSSYAVGYGVEARGTHFHVAAYDKDRGFAAELDATLRGGSTGAAASSVPTDAETDVSAFIAAVERSLQDLRAVLQKGLPEGGEGDAVRKA